MRKPAPPYKNNRTDSVPYGNNSNFITISGSNNGNGAIGSNGIFIPSSSFHFDLEYFPPDAQEEYNEPALKAVSLSGKESELCDAIDVLEKIVANVQQDNDILRKEVDRLFFATEIVLTHSAYKNMVEQAFKLDDFELKLSMPDGRVIHLKVKN